MLRKEVKDTLSSTTAYKLAQKIEDYWLGEGYVVKAWIEPVRASIKSESTGEDVVQTIFQVRSDLLNGIPKASSAYESTP